MGLLTLADGAEDAAALFSLGIDLATQWNESAAGSPDVGYGFKILSVQDDCETVCALGTRVLKAYFSDPPSAFKRVAAVIVIGRLFPFIGFDPERANESESHRWLARLMVTMVPLVLRSIDTTVTPCHLPRKSQTVTLKGFKRWPSVHVKAEFIEWMSSLDSLPDIVATAERKGDIIADQRLARMIMAASLIIENAYYCMECAPATPTDDQIRTKCLPCIEKISTDIDLMYEGVMLEPPPADSKTFGTVDRPTATRPP
jgi:hypothetical protein